MWVMESLGQVPSLGERDEGHGGWATPHPLRAMVSWAFISTMR
jgi:hypothetical protein